MTDYSFQSRERQITEAAAVLQPTINRYGPNAKVFLIETCGSASIEVIIDMMIELRQRLGSDDSVVTFLGRALKNNGDDIRLRNPSFEGYTFPEMIRESPAGATLLALTQLYLMKRGKPPQTESVNSGPDVEPSPQG